MHPAIASKQEELVALCRRHGVARLEIFGSAARGEDFDPQASDADFLVEFGPTVGPRTLDRYFDFRDALHDALGRPVDLVEFGAVQNPYLRASIDESRELVHAA